ncbi:formylglycine-generating enzyme family protein [Microcoleus sp. BR0-C5]|uniref:formylglycine-generating enzyme family protein n=1 Tax=Microcoleus sp. BR0-C5 TaxID=2818713 RepID=UPI002FD5D2D4
MTENQNQPREYEAVLGGQNPPPIDAAVLGGISGVKSRLASPIVEVKIAALSEALKYGDAGLDLIIGVLQEESMLVKFAAYSLLQTTEYLKEKLPLHNYLPTFEFDAITVNFQPVKNSCNRHYAHFFPEDLGNEIVLEMVGIPGGTFMMGSPSNETGRYDYESPQHPVTVPAFFAGKYPITQAQWQAMMGNNPSNFKGEKRPVENVSWDDAVEFCSQLWQKTGKKYRLLSEAEWEYACRAGTTTAFHFGKYITTEIANYDASDPCGYTAGELYRKETTDVGIFPPNAFGLYDMHGNVSEWCSDRWNQNYNGAPTDGSSWETGTDDYRVLRGGCWVSECIRCRCASRGASSAGNTFSGNGFRVAVASLSPSS